LFRHPSARYNAFVNPRRFLSLLALFALLAMPFGHMQASAHVGGPTTAGHCHGGAAPAHGKADRNAIDCTIACAAIAPASHAPTAPAVTAPVLGQIRIPAAHGIVRAADPPPPRLA